jgi:hypothetical protein
MFGKSEDKEGHRPGITPRSVAAMIPGMQFELIETGRRLKINPRHIVITCLIGVLGGLFIGGWGFLTHGYADGGDNIRGAWLYNSWAWFANSFC